MRTVQQVVAAQQALHGGCIFHSLTSRVSGCFRVVGHPYLLLGKQNSVAAARTVKIAIPLLVHVPTKIVE